jgi:hypothetical protein
MNDPEDRGPRGELGAGIAFGLLLTLLIWYGGGYLSSALGGSVTIVGVLAVVGAFVLVARGGRFARGIGIGLLIGAALALLFFGALWIACMNTP